MDNFYLKGKQLLDTGNTEKAKQVFNVGVQNRDVKCTYGLLATAAICEESIDEYEAELRKEFDQISTAADDGDAEAAFIIGRCYEVGVVTSKDLHLAVKYYSKSSKLGCADAMFNLGCIYIEQGIETSQVIEHFFIPAAKKENANACFALGYYYESTEDTESASYWYQKAATNGTPQMKEKYEWFVANRTNCRKENARNGR